MKLTIILFSLWLAGCTLHFCGNTEIAHQVGDGSIGEDQQQKDSTSAEVRAEVPEIPVE